MSKLLYLILLINAFLSGVFAETTINVSSAISSFIVSVFSELSPGQQSSLLSAIYGQTTLTNTVATLPTSQLSSLASSILSTMTFTSTTTITTTASNAATSLRDNGLVGPVIAIVLGLLAVLVF